MSGLPPRTTRERASESMAPGARLAFGGGFRMFGLAASLVLVGCGAIATSGAGSTPTARQGQRPSVDACADAADRLERAHVGPGGATFALRLVPDTPAPGDQVTLRGSDVTPGMNRLVASYYLQDYPPDSGATPIPDIVIADVPVDADGRMAATFTMPAFRPGTCVLIHAIPAGQRPFEGALARPFLTSQ